MTAARARARPEDDRALRDPHRYPHPVERVELLETHISWVLLTGRYAYKLKKPVSLGFLDFSTLEARRTACEEELRLNRRTAPDLYLEVVPVTGTEAEPRLGGEGRAIDYAVKMREFPQDALLDRVAARGELRLELMDDLAAEVAAFHAQIARAAPGSEFGSPADVIAQARQNFDQLRALGPDRESAAALQRLAEWTEREFARRAPAFAARRDAGFVRECHGDLHLRNLLLLDGRIVPFDCIEFNAHFRWIDVMSEVAFLVMDLVDHGFATHAARFLDAYLEGTGDYAGLGCLRFYLVYRAMVRAKVAWMRGHQLPAGTPERGRAEGEFRDYLRLAERFVALERRALILTRGLSGSGKTVFSGLLVEEIGAIRVRSDVERKRLHGLAAAERTGAAVGGGIYGPDATRRTYARLADDRADRPRRRLSGGRRRDVPPARRPGRAPRARARGRRDLRDRRVRGAGAGAARAYPGAGARRRRRLGGESGRAREAAGDRRAARRRRAHLRGHRRHRRAISRRCGHLPRRSAPGSG